MKVLFAVHDEKVSLSIVKKYQKEYKEIISYKNVYYFNAILKELQRDKTYDRIIIDEDLEEFTSSSYEQKDKFIFDRLDTITDEASNSIGNDIPIILICSERRTKSEEFLVKIFGIGIYNAIIGNDRSTDEVCRLLNKPRSKKDAKVYYRIDSEDVSYKHENEDEVTEEEIRYILSYFKRIGKNEDKYVDVFKNIASQYNEKQLKIVISMLPLHVRSVLEESSPEYQKVVAKGGGAYRTAGRNVIREDNGPSEKLLTNNKADARRPIVVPSKMDKTLIKKITIKKPSITPKTEEIENNELLDDTNEMLDEIKPVEPEQKRGRGRPRKNPIVQEMPETPKRGRGRPRKNPPIEVEDINTIEEDEDDLLPGFTDVNINQNEEENKLEDVVMPGFEDIDYENERENKNENLLPGFEDIEDEEDEEDEMLPGFEEDSIDENQSMYENKYDEEFDLHRFESNTEEPKNNRFVPEKSDYEYYDYTEYNNLLSSTRKVIAFVGTSKNGTSFIINNIAKILSNNGIDTAILDATKNKNAYYIYTKNEEDLRQRAANSIENLINGTTQGVEVRNNLTVYTELPNQDENMRNVGPILENLVKRHACVLIDCDFDTPMEYFDKAQEIYLVQSMDVLTIQPLTAFLRELKGKNILNENKLRIILNKVVKIRGVSPKTIVGGMAFYNDPEMSFMTELFDKELITPIIIPFDVDVYRSYLEQIIDCEITIDGYSKDFQTVLKNLASVIYPLLPAKSSKTKKGYQYDVNTNNYSNNGFSNSVNNTLNNMKRRY